MSVSNPSKLRVFLFHAKEDEPIVRELYQRLSAERWIEPWLDEEQLLPGQDQALETKKALEAAGAVIVFLSKTSISQEGYIQKVLKDVIKIADEKPEDEIFVIPIRLDDSSTPDSLKKQYPVDFFPEDRQDWAYKRVLESLKVRGRKFALNFPELNKTVYTKKLERVEFRTLGESEYAKVESGVFLMGSSKLDSNSSDFEKPLYEANIAYDYWIGRHSVTNSQYAIFAKDVGISFSFPKGKELHPVVYVSWRDSLGYIQWLNKKHAKDLGRVHRLALPSEPEWEKAARGTDGRVYPWGVDFDASYDQGVDLGRDRCNIDESQKGGTVAVIENSPGGDSPYGAANMVGNVWEWTRSLWSRTKEAPEPEYIYPYKFNDGREDESVDGPRILRGGSFFNSRWLARCAFRGWDMPEVQYRYVGFRIAIIPFSRG
jgi:formylglycine-generating enzyme required for sulfatase activity